MTTFTCLNCQKLVSEKAIGTHQRNHCPYCLYSLHVDEKFAGDRKSLCHGLMKPIGLTFKEEGIDKYGKKRQGEIMLIHLCQNCGKINSNRIAGDDEPNEIIHIFEIFRKLNPEKKKQFEESGITLLEEKDRSEVEKQLFGKA